MFKLSQETIAIVTVGLALAALILSLIVFIASSTNDLRAEGRADRAAAQAAREAIRAENRADREAWQAENQRIRAEARADRETWQAEMRALREDAGADREAVNRLYGIVEQMRTAER